MLKKLLYVVLLTSCFDLIIITFNSCCNKDPLCKHVADISLDIYDNSGNKPVAVANNKVLADAFLLRMNVKLDSMYEFCFQSSNSILISKLYATSCEAINKYDSVVYYSIVSDSKFDDKHPAGESLNDLFRPPLMKEIDGKNDYDFLLLEQPEISGTHKFTVKIQFSNDNYFEASTEPVKLLK